MYFSDMTQIKNFIDKNFDRIVKVLEMVIKLIDITTRN